MKPGRELDCEIAVKVFGASVTKTIQASGYSYLITNKRINHPCCSCMEDRYESIDYYEVPEYSTDIRVAWEVVQYFAAKDGHHSPSITSAYLDEGLPKGWCVSLGCVYSVFGETAPHAICLAALKAVSC